MGKAIIIVAGGFFGLTVLAPMMATTDYGGVLPATLAGEMYLYKALGAVVGVAAGLLINMLVFSGKSK